MKHEAHAFVFYFQFSFCVFLSVRSVCSLGHWTCRAPVVQVAAVVFVYIWKKYSWAWGWWKEDWRLYQISNQHKYLKYCSADLFRELILNLTFFLKQGLIIYQATSQPHWEVLSVKRGLQSKFRQSHQGSVYKVSEALKLVIPGDIIAIVHLDTLSGIQSWMSHCSTLLNSLSVVIMENRQTHNTGDWRRDQMKLERTKLIWSWIKSNLEDWPNRIKAEM